MTAVLQDSPRALPPAGRAALRGGIAGNYVDQLHIFLPLVALAPALPRIAGPQAAAATGALVVMALLLGRPIGSLVFGPIADRLGRTRTTRIAIAGTALCALGIAAIPTHEAIGGFAVAGIIALRFLGGVFIAGEYSAAIPLAMEWSRPRRRGLVSGLIMSMAPWAQASIAFATAGLLVGLGPQAYAAWGWRLAFVAGALGSVAMLVYYRRVHDVTGTGRGTPAQAARGRLRQVMFGPHAKDFWRLFTLMTGLWFLTQMTVIVLAGRLGPATGVGATTAATIMGFAAVGQAIVMALAGQWSTSLGRRRFFVLWGILAAVAAPFVWVWTLSGGQLAAIAAGAVLLQVITVTAYGPIGAYLSEGFPADVRSTGYGTAYSLSIVIPALYPFYLPALESLLGRQGGPIALLVLGGLLVAGCGALGPAVGRQELADG
ncbi:MFS transporter [Enemella evansiae]|uniref:MFS transporter n=1 Tax=Enemella evansiae TaxID=2016499 RepID=UPI001E3CE946|nr:MFS transporter [Enemella evansiae]